MTEPEIIIVGQTLAADRGWALSTVSRKATGGTNPDLLDRLLVGGGCNTSTRLKVEDWFRTTDEWPKHLPWPLPGLRESTRRCAAE